MEPTGIPAEHHESPDPVSGPERHSAQPRTRRVLLWLSITLLGLAAAGGAFWWYGQRPAAKSERSPGMPMSASAQSNSTENAITIAPEKQQLIGMRSVPAAVRVLVKDIRAEGKIAFDETKVTHIHTKVSGYIEETYADFVGQPVKKGQALFTIYSPDLVATQQEYLLALKSRNTLKDSSFPFIADGSANLLAASRERLRLWDVTDREIDRLEREGTVKRALAIYSPVSGIVTERAAYHHGKFVTPETDLYTIVDLSKVWVLGQVYEADIPYVRVGQVAEVQFPYATTQQILRGRVDYFYPYLDPNTRTAQIRLEFPNPDFRLRPDEFVNVNLHVNMGSQLSVPEDAVMNSGTEQYVFVDKGDGYIEPRPVTLGPQAGGYYGIVKGLKSGERVVTSANFIVDSESRLKGAFANMGKPSGTQAAGQPAAGPKLQIDVMEPKTAKVGANTMRVMVKDAAGNPVEGAEVQVTLFMPQMGSMAPMSSKATLQPSGNGIYSGTIEFQMAWTWQTAIVVKKNGNVLGTVQTNLTAR